MKFRKITAEFNTGNIALAEEMICHVFFSFNLKGVVCDIPIPEPDEGFGTSTLPLPEQNAIIGYLPDMDASDIIVEQIKEKLAGLAGLDVHVTPRITVVDEKDWADAWKDYFHVTRITDRIVVKPEWKSHTPAPDDIVIHIDPGMAFGTGTHPTTAMCLELIDDLLIPGQSVLDVGCGSGILMIAAAKLGAGSLTGIDTDPMAVDITRDNLAKNKVDPARLHLTAATLDQTPETPYDLVVANIIAQVIVDITGDIKQRIAPGGSAILSGIIRERKPDVLSALSRHNLGVIREKTMGEWVALVVRHESKGRDL
ncbi:MAG: 50S ribosomal protein L11 methyltransferase [Desulfobacterales bacterium]|nr:50S ribosomal protein L11 methyltransferase [Desulfobacterales bacterium]